MRAPSTPADRRFRTGLAVVLVVAAALRVASLVASSRLPSFTHHRLDALLYHEAGRALAGGDLTLGREVLHMSPAYTALVGGVYAVAGDGPWALRIVQLALGLGTVALIALAARRLLGARWALVAGALAALYGPFVFYETQLLAACLAAFLHALILALALRALASGRARDFAAAGVALGLAVVTRPTAGLLAAPLVLAAWPRRPRAPAAVLLASALVVTPTLLRNWIVAGEPVPVTDAGGLNFYLGNGPGAIGTFRVPREIPDAGNASAQFVAFRREAERARGRPLSSREVDAYWTGRALAGIRAAPATWARLLVEKTWLFWSARELPNTEDYSFHRRIQPVLALPLVQFGWIAPLALLGTILLLVGRGPGRDRDRGGDGAGRDGDGDGADRDGRDRAGAARAGDGAARDPAGDGAVRAGRLVALVNLCGLAALVAFFVLAHYRLPAVPGLILAAVAALARLVELARARRRAARVALAAAGLALAAAALLVFTPKLPKAFDDEYFKLGYAYHVTGRPAEAERAYRDALAIDADNLSARKNLGALLASQGDRPAAAREWRELAERAARAGRADYVAEARRRLAEAAPGLVE